MTGGRGFFGSNFVRYVARDEVCGYLALDVSARFNEESPYHSNAPYSSIKASPDMLVRAGHRAYGVEAPTSNCSNNYSPYQRVV